MHKLAQACVCTQLNATRIVMHVCGPQQHSADGTYVMSAIFTAKLQITATSCALHLALHARSGANLMKQLMQQQMSHHCLKRLQLLQHWSHGFIVVAIVVVVP